MSKLNRDLEDIEYGRKGPTREVAFPEEAQLPDGDSLAWLQHRQATKRLGEDKSKYPRFSRLSSVHELTGSFAPGEIIFIAGGTGNGKSLLCQNLFDDLMHQEIPTLYIGTEQTVDVLKIKHACIRTGVSPRLMLKPETRDIGTTGYEAARAAVQKELEWLHNPVVRELIFYANTPFVNRVELTRWISGGVRKYGLQCVIIDHIDQVSHGEGQNSVHELTQTVQHLHTLAHENKIPIVAASQIKRTLDPIRRYSPPDESDLAGASGKERIMSVGLGLWRPLRADLSIEELREMKKKAATGSVGRDKIYQADTMGVRLLKDRLGTVPGKQCFLYVGKGGKLEDDPATTHGIKP